MAEVWIVFDLSKLSFVLIPSLPSAPFNVQGSRRLMGQSHWSKDMGWTSYSIPGFQLISITSCKVFSSFISLVLYYIKMRSHLSVPDHLCYSQSFCLLSIFNVFVSPYRFMFSTQWMWPSVLPSEKCSWCRDHCLNPPVIVGYVPFVFWDVHSFLIVYILRVSDAEPVKQF